MPMRLRARRLVAAILAAGVLATASVSPALAVGVVGDGTDDKVTGRRLRPPRRRNGPGDRALQRRAHRRDAGSRRRTRTATSTRTTAATAARATSRSR